MQLIGRGDELDAVIRFVLDDAPGLRALELEGVAGIGKTMLWRAGVSTAREHGRRVLVARPTGPDQRLAFAGLADLLDGVGDEELSSLPPPRRHALRRALLREDGDGAVDQRALGVAIRDVVDSLGEVCHVVVAIDDVQWLDTDSAQALGFALRRVTSPVRVLLACRATVDRNDDEPLPGWRTEDLRRVVVGPLDVTSMGMMLDAHLDRRLARPVLERVHAVSDGNPFYALEIVRSIDGPVDPTRPLPIPEALEDVMTQRLAALPEATRRALGVVAVAGGIELEMLASASILEADLAQAIDARVLELDGSRLVFHHPLQESAVAGRLLPAERRRSHRLVATFVNEDIARARHLALGADGTDLDLAEMVDEAARSASARGAVGVAAELRAHALRLTPDDADVWRHSRTIALAESQLANGNHAEAERLARQLVVDSPAGRQRAEAILLLFDVVGDQFDLIPALREGLLHAADDEVLSTKLHALLGKELWLDGAHDAAKSHVLAAMDVAERLGDEPLKADVLWIHASHLVHSGAEGSAAAFERAYRCTARIADARARAQLSRSIAGVWIWADRHDQIRDLLEPACADLADRDELACVPVLDTLSLVEFVAGRLHLAERIARESLEISRAYGLDALGMFFPMALIAAFRGHYDEACDLVASERRFDLGMPWLDAQLEAILGRINLWSADPEQACEHFVAAERHPSHEPGIPRWRAEYVEALLVLGRPVEAEAVVDGWESDARRLERAAVLAETRRCRGQIAAANGAVTEASTALEQAADLSALAGDPVGRARALLALGMVRRRSKQKRASLEAIELAISLFDECGADGMAAAARTELSTLSGRRRQHGLTAAERRVSELAAAGRTNREIAAELFLAVSTVETHLSHVYSKLGIRSRTELARSLAQP